MLSEWDVEKNVCALQIEIGERKERDYASKCKNEERNAHTHQTKNT